MTQSNLFNPIAILSKSQEATLKRVRTLSLLTDNLVTIPGTEIGVGLDPLIGLLPAGGDIAGMVLSAYIVLEAARFGVPSATVLRMVWNLIFDGLVGMVPMLGDLLDVGWKANTRNLRLLESHIIQGTLQRKADRKFMFLLVLTLGLIIVGFAALITLVVGGIWTLFSRLLGL
ncbi:MAG: DUF4112 domain-containing protein [Synechococcales bacterium]|nr:DUF4112 domain-containing protein [Synechococcales bacterium]